MFIHNYTCLSYVYNIYIYIYIYTHTHIYIYTYMTTKAQFVLQRWLHSNLVLGDSPVSRFQESAVKDGEARARARRREGVGGGGVLVELTLFRMF